jgi:hypothetical protein
MKPEQALDVLSQLVNSPVVKLACDINSLSACDLALRTLADALKPKPEPTPEKPA